MSDMHELLTMEYATEVRDAVADRLSDLPISEVCEQVWHYSHGSIRYVYARISGRDDDHPRVWLRCQHRGSPTDTGSLEDTARELREAIQAETDPPPGRSVWPDLVQHYLYHHRAPTDIRIYGPYDPDEAHRLADEIEGDARVKQVSVGQPLDSDPRSSIGHE